MLFVSRKWFKTYFKSRTHVPSDVHTTKNYVLKSRGDLCHALTVEKSFLHQTLSTVVQLWRDTVIPSNRLQDNRPDTIIPLIKVRLDMAAYTFTYHMENGCALEKDCFGGNKHVWELLLKYRFEEHSACHKASCFKKGCECRFLFPYMSTTSTYIHEDKGVKNENEILWHSLDGSTREICPFIVLP